MVADSLELDNVDKVSSNIPARKPRNREVSSRYKSGLSSARRFPSPNIGRSGDGADAPPKRALSAERKRDSDESSDPALRPNGSGKIRAGTPERKRRQNIDQLENARPLENVGFTTQKLGKPMSRSMDLSMGRVSGIGVKGSRCLAPVRSFNFLVGKAEERRSSTHEKPGEATSNDETGCMRSSAEDGTSNNVARAPPKVKPNNRDDAGGFPEKPDEARGRANQPGVPPKRAWRDDTRYVRASVDEAASAACDTDNFGSENGDGDDNASFTSGVSAAPQPSSRTSSKPVRGTIVPARFWQDLNNRIRRLSDVNQLRSSMPEGGESLTGSRTVRRIKGSSAPSSGANSPATNPSSNSASNPGTPWIYSPVRAPPAPPPPLSPVKGSSPSRPSPTRTRGVPAKQSVACMLNFGADVARTRRAMSQQEEAQCLRVFHNRWLQWRFVNARAEAGLSTQQATAQRLLYSTSVQISDLQSRVADKRIRLQKARLDSKVHSSITSHGGCLEEWGGLEEEHSSSLSGAVKALEAGTLKVPVTGGAKIDVQSLRNALNSAAESMAPLDSTTRALLPNAEKTSEVVSQLAEVSSQGRSLLQECGELLDIIAALEIEERSLRGYFVQLETENQR